MPEDEQLEYFLKVEPYLLINEAPPESDTIVELRKELDESKKGKYDHQDQLDILKEEIQSISKGFALLLANQGKTFSRDTIEKVMDDPKMEPMFDAQYIEELLKLGKDYKK